MPSTPTRLNPISVPSASREQEIASLLARIVSDDPEIRTAAWFGAREIGPAAIAPLAELMSHPNAEAARAAKRGVWKIVRHASRPGADTEREESVAALIGVLEGEGSVPLKTEALRMLGEIGSDSAVQPIAAHLADVNLREEARMALERIPGQPSLSALVQSFVEVPDDFKPAVVRSLRNRGVKVEGHPEQKLIPTQPTSVKPIG